MSTKRSNMLERGKVGVQADQSKVTFDNMKVTRVRATDLTMDLEEQLEALTGPIDINYTVQFSDGVEEEVPAKEVKLYSNDESVIKVMDNKLYPIEEGKATVKAIYENVEIEKEVTV